MKKGTPGDVCPRRAPALFLAVLGAGAPVEARYIDRSLESAHSEVTAATMRHWITSFRLLRSARYSANAPGCKGPRRAESAQSPQKLRFPIEEVMRSSIVGEGCGGAGSASRP